MGIIVGIAIVAVLALIVAATAGGDQIDSMNPYYGMDEEQLAELEELREGGRRHEECSGPVVSDSNYFDRLMTPGSDEDAWHNAALDEGYDPENW